MQERTKCLTEAKTKSSFVYIKAHAYKPHMPKSIHNTIENIEIEVLIKPNDDESKIK